MLNKLGIVCLWDCLSVTVSVYRPFPWKPN